MTEATGHSRYGVYRAGSDLIEVSGSSKDHTALLHWLHDQSSPPPPPEAHLRSYLSCIHEKTHRDGLHDNVIRLTHVANRFHSDDRYPIVNPVVRTSAQPARPLATTRRNDFIGRSTFPKEAKAHEYVYKVAGELARLLKFRALIWAGDASKGVTLRRTRRRRQHSPWHPSRSFRFDVDVDVYDGAARCSRDSLNPLRDLVWSQDRDAGLRRSRGI